MTSKTAPPTRRQAGEDRRGARLERDGHAMSEDRWPGAAKNWAAYAAAGWAFGFALVSFYWAAGGTLGLGTLAEGIRERVQAGDAGFIAVLWATGVAKALGGAVALALVRPWPHRVPRWLRLAAAWGAGVLLVLYGGINMVGLGLVEAGVVNRPTGVDPSAKWYLLVWEPIFLAGGVLFCLAAWRAGRSTPSAGAGAGAARGSVLRRDQS